MIAGSDSDFRGLPDDPALPGLAAIRATGVARAIPELHLGDAPVELAVRAHMPGRRITLELRSGTLSLAVKAYSKSPDTEVALTQAFAAAGLARDHGARVPPLVTWKRDLRIIVVGWLDGPTASELMKLGQGERAAELAARWLEVSSALQIEIGPPRDSGWMIRRSRKWVARLGKADAALGAAATELAEYLRRTRPPAEARRLAHGTFHDRNVIDCGDGPGIIDWEFCGMGPPEIDAGAFLACMTWRSSREGHARAAAQARERFLSRVGGTIDLLALGWHEAAWLMCRAARAAKRHGEDGADLAKALLAKAHEAGGAVG